MIKINNYRDQTEKTEKKIIKIKNNLLIINRLL